MRPLHSLICCLFPPPFFFIYTPPTQNFLHWQSAYSIHLRSFALFVLSPLFWKWLAGLLLSHTSWLFLRLFVKLNCYSCAFTYQYDCPWMYVFPPLTVLVLAKTTPETGPVRKVDPFMLDVFMSTIPPGCAYLFGLAFLSNVCCCIPGILKSTVFDGKFINPPPQR